MMPAQQGLGSNEHSVFDLRLIEEHELLGLDAPPQIFLHGSQCDAPDPSASRMVLALSVALELRAVKVDLAQFSRAVPLGLIVEVRGRRIAALPAGRYGPGPHAVAELHHGDEAVAAGARDRKS